MAAGVVAVLLLSGCGAGAPERGLTGDEIETMLESIEIPEGFEDAGLGVTVTQDEGPGTVDSLARNLYHPDRRSNHLEDWASEGQAPEACLDATESYRDAEEEALEEFEGDETDADRNNGRLDLRRAERSGYIPLDITSATSPIFTANEEQVEYWRQCLEELIGDEVVDTEDLDFGQMSGWLYIDDDESSRAALWGDYEGHTRIHIDAEMEDAEELRENLETIVEDLEEQLHEFED